MRRSIVGLIWVALLAALATGCGLRTGTAGDAAQAPTARAAGTGAAVTPIATASGDEQGGTMSSSGDGTAAQAPSDGSAAPRSDAAGRGDAAAGEAAAASPPAPAAPSTWLVYRDATLSFSLSYPDSYVRLAEPASLGSVAPDLVQRVRFQDKQLAAAETADLEPPQFAIEVFENKASLTLEQWIDANAPPGSARATVAVGNRHGYQVTLTTMLAPNQFYYVADGAYVYRVTPLGSQAGMMLASLKIGS